MTANASGVLCPPATRPAGIGTWGTATHFSRLTGADHETSAYWVRVVARGAHRMGHPKLTIEGCPGCAYEQAVAA